MKIKKRYLSVIILSWFIMVCVLSPVINGYEIIDNKVVIEDENVYLSADPHTIYCDTTVFFNLTSKKYSGNIDIALGINSSHFNKPSNPYFKIGNGSYIPLGLPVQTFNITFKNMTKWYVLRNVGITALINYSLKLDIDIDGNSKGKYFFGIKASHLPFNTGYYIDPWWDFNEDFTTYIEIDNVNNDIIVNSGVNVSGITMTRTDTAYLYRDMGSDYFGDFLHAHDVLLISSSAESSYVGIWGMSTDLGDIADWTYGLTLFIYRTGGIPKMMLYERNGGEVLDISTSLTWGYAYYMVTERTGTTMTCKIYNDYDRTSLKDTITGTVSTTKCRYIYPMVSYDTGTSGKGITVNSLNLTLNQTSVQINIYDILPVNNSIDICPCCPVLSVTVSSPIGNLITISFLSNESGVWTELDEFLSVINGTYSIVAFNISKFNLTYYWRVNTSTKDGSNTSGILIFNTTSDINCSDTYSKTEADDIFLSDSLSLTPPTIILSLYAFLFYLGNKHKDVMLTILSSLLLLVLAFYYIAEFNAISILVSVCLFAVSGVGIVIAIIFSREMRSNK